MKPVVRSALTLAAQLGLAGTCLWACEDKVIMAPPGAGPREPTRAAASASASAAPPVAGIPESEFAESATSRDPFRSYARNFVDENKAVAKNQLNVVMPEYSLDELKLIGIVSRIEPAKAMLVDPTGKGHVIQRGMFVGRADVVQTSGNSGSTFQVNWRVDRIRADNVVLVRGDPTNPDVPTMTRVIPLRPEPAAEEPQQ